MAYNASKVQGYTEHKLPINYYEIPLVSFHNETVHLYSCFLSYPNPIFTLEHLLLQFEKVENVFTDYQL